MAAMRSLDLDADIKQRNGNRCSRSTPRLQCAGEAEAVQQAERERYDPWRSLLVRPASPCRCEGFRRHEHDAQRNGRFDGWPGT